MLINYYQDPGHGWLRVPRSLVVELQIDDQISSYSYQQGDVVFLEEDCDAGIFARAMKQQGREFKTIEIRSDSESWIRALKPYGRA